MDVVSPVQVMMLGSKSAFGSVGDEEMVIELPTSVVLVLGMKVGTVELRADVEELLAKVVAGALRYSVSVVTT